MIRRTLCQLMVSSVAVALALTASGIAPGSSAPAARPTKEACALGVQALSLRAASILDGSRSARCEWVRDYKEGLGRADVRHERVALPRYAGAGETAIHKAIREAERLLEAGQDVEALGLLIELTSDMKQALETHQIETLMEKWNARYPSGAAVDILESDLPSFIAAAREVYRRLMEDGQTEEDQEASTRRTREDDAWLARLRQTLFSALEEAARNAQYESALEMLQDSIQAAHMQTQYAVEIPPVLEERFGERSPVMLMVTGMPTVAELLRTLEKRYRALKELNWSLLIDGQSAELVAGVILPGQRLEIVLGPESRPGPGGGTATPGPKFRLDSWLLLALIRILPTYVARAMAQRALHLGRKRLGLAAGLYRAG